MNRPAVVPARAERPWGFYQVLDEADGFRVKRLCIRKGQRISYQRHSARAEHWYVVSGHGRATVDDVDVDVVPGSCVDVRLGAAHRVTNTGAADLILIEVQAGTYLGEDDIERLADDYGRGDGGAGVRVPAAWPAGWAS
jgi:mannose-6-phosphate isomerase